MAMVTVTAAVVPPEEQPQQEEQNGAAEAPAPAAGRACRSCFRALRPGAVCRGAAVRCVCVLLVAAMPLLSTQTSHSDPRTTCVLAILSNVPTSNVEREWWV
jgi:hypothetical protein